MEYLWKFLLLVVCANVAQGWRNKDKIKLTDIEVLTLQHSKMTSGRRSSPVPQAKCVGGTAGCRVVPKVVQCYNRGSDGFDVQWECKADMNNKYRFGEVAVNCEGYDYPDDPYILKGSCGVEYTIDHVDGHSYDSSYDSNHHHSYHGNYGYKKHRRSSGWMSSFIMWGVIACIAYYIYTTLSANQTTTSNTQSGYQQASTSPPPPGFRPEYTTQDQSQYQGSSTPTDTSSNYGGFWTGMGMGGLAGYLFGNRGYGNTGYHHHYSNPYYHHNNSWFGGGGNGWFGGNYHNHDNTGWFGGNGGNTGWFGSNGGSSSSWSSTYRRSGSSSSSGSRTASGFGGTKRR